VQWFRGGLAFKAHRLSGVWVDLLQLRVARHQLLHLRRPRFGRGHALGRDALHQLRGPGGHLPTRQRNLLHKLINLLHKLRNLLHKSINLLHKFEIHYKNSEIYCINTRAAAVPCREWYALGRDALHQLRGPGGHLPTRQRLFRNVQWFRGGLVFEAHRLLYHSA